jgi:hypothetical protein
MNGPLPTERREIIDSVEGRDIVAVCVNSAMKSLHYNGFISDAWPRI